MKWITLESREKLPREKDGKRFLAVWNGKIGLVEYGKDEDRFYISQEPKEDARLIEQSKEFKFTHWMELPTEPEFLCCPTCKKPYNP